MKATALSRRCFLASLSAALPAATAYAAEITGKGRILPPAAQRYADAATDFPVTRLTDPAHTSRLPPHYARAISRHSNFLIFVSDMTGRFEAYRMDLKSGQMRQVTEAEDLDPASVALLADDHGFCYFDGDRLMAANLTNLKAREVYRISDGFRRAALNLAEDGQYAVVVEKAVVEKAVIEKAVVETRDATHRLQLVSMATGTAKKLVECDEEIRDPLPRPKRASILYARGPANRGNIWLADYDGQHNYRLRIADGGTGPAMWSPDGRTVLYLNYPEDSHKLHAIREFTPDANDDKMIANTSQFVQFGCNADASVFVGASGSKASPYVLLLVRAVHREMTLAEHRASDPAMVAPIFAPNSQRIFFGSDRHGKPAIYAMSVEKFVEETDADRA